METKKIIEIEAVILKKDELKVAQDSIYKRYESVETFNRELFQKSEYAKLLRGINENEVVLLGKLKINGSVRYEMHQVIKRLCDRWGIEFDELLKRCRFRHYVEKRQLIHYILKRCSDKQIIPFMPLVEIGKLTLRDHATVIHSIKVIENRLKFDKYFPEEFEKLLIDIELYGKL